mgnify:CR=1 FL=1
MVHFAFLNVILLAFLFIGLLFALTALLQWLWNITMPEVFNLKTIDYWQAFRLLLIAGILFGAGGIRFIT